MTGSAVAVRSDHRRSPGDGEPAVASTQPVRQRHFDTWITRRCPPILRSRCSTATCAAARRRARPSSRSSPWPGWSRDCASRKTTLYSSGEFFLPGQRPRLPRLAPRRTRLGRPVQLDGRVGEHLLLQARDGSGHRPVRCLLAPLRLRRADRHRPDRRDVRRRPSPEWKRSRFNSRGISARRSSPASARATGWLPRCSWRRAPRGSPTAVCAAGCAWCNRSASG